ncbi:MAG: methionine adenosyltransferase [Propionibacteriaceae bacterium]|nr:methionine adenosyltransferase [Propionibacteriaceae bacterium]
MFTSESVTEGHPDKVADAISDAVLDAMLRDDPKSHCAIETMVANGVVLVAGEATTESYVDVATLVRQTLIGIGYDDPRRGLDGGSCGVLVAVNNQSPDIAMGVSASWESRHGQVVDDFDRQGAGDQGLMFGFACNETPALMPLPIDLAHRLSERLAAVRHEGILAYLRPDGKTQVTIDYDDQMRPRAVDTIVVSAQHDDDIAFEKIEDDLRREVVAPVLARYDVNGSHANLLVNPTGRFVIGGPLADSGLTGRKIIVDTYGGMARHGGGAFSGKDPSKVDRSASYALRWVAKNVVAAGLATRCEVQAAYAIGRAHPVSLDVNTSGTGIVPDHRISQAISAVFDLRPAAIIERLDLTKPIYARTTNYGHFGRDGFTWERTDMAAELTASV